MAWVKREDLEVIEIAAVEQPENAGSWTEEEGTVEQLKEQYFPS